MSSSRYGLLTNLRDNDRSVILGKPSCVQERSIIFFFLLNSNVGCSQNASENAILTWNYGWLSHYHFREHSLGMLKIHLLFKKNVFLECTILSNLHFSKHDKFSFKCRSQLQNVRVRTEISTLRLLREAAVLRM